MTWEGAELCFYMNGESHTIGLSNIQFSIITKILGMQYQHKTQQISFYSDNTLQQIAKMKGNPLKLEKTE